MKRIYFLLAISVLQLIVGSFMFYGAASPTRLSNDVVIQQGDYLHLEYGILGAGRVSANLTELNAPARPFDLFVFDDAGYASFRDGANGVPPLFEANGTDILFDFALGGSGTYHVVVVDFPAREALLVRVDLVVGGLKTNDTILAGIVLAGGLTLIGATLTLSVWAWRRGPPAPPAPTPPPQDPSQGPPLDPPQDPGPQADPVDDTRVY